MNSNFEATLLKYYEGKLRAERDCAIMKSKNEVLTKHLQVCFILLLLIINYYRNKYLFVED